MRRKNNAKNQEKKAGTPRVRTPAPAVDLTKAISLDSSLTRAMGPSTSTPLTIPSAEPAVRRGDFEPVFLEDLTRYSNVLEDHPDNGTAIHLAIGRLKAARIREKGSLKALESLFENRRSLIDGLIGALEIAGHLRNIKDQAINESRARELAELVEEGKEDGWLVGEDH